MALALLNLINFWREYKGERLSVKQQRVGKVERTGAEEVRKFRRNIVTVTEEVMRYEWGAGLEE